jgi:hypothetical protein
MNVTEACLKKKGDNRGARGLSGEAHVGRGGQCSAQHASPRDRRMQRIAMKRSCIFTATEGLCLFSGLEIHWICYR